ncbi:MAG: hypothetical protein AB7S50_05725 [Bacteroidales bacterium]
MFIIYCNDDAGLKIYDAANSLTITSNQIAQYSDIQTNDVISLKRKTLLFNNDGFYPNHFTDEYNKLLLGLIAVMN